MGQGERGSSSEVRIPTELIGHLVCVRCGQYVAPPMVRQVVRRGRVICVDCAAAGLADYWGGWEASHADV